VEVRPLDRAEPLRAVELLDRPGVLLLLLEAHPQVVLRQVVVEDHAVEAHVVG